MQSHMSRSVIPAPFKTDLTKFFASEISKAAIPSDNLGPYDPLLAACSRTQNDDLVVPHAGPDYLARELSVQRLNDIHRWLWVVSLPMPPRALHQQKLLGRQIVLAERMDMHLVWSESRIFMKPLPRFLLDPRFWSSHLSCHSDCGCTNPSGEHNKRPAKCQELRKCALGFLLSYAALVSYESDFFMAEDEHLLPKGIPWLAWKQFVKELLEDEPTHRYINKRFIYGELRLNRLNAIYRIARGNVRGYQSGYSQYSSFLQANFTWLASALAYIVIVLAAMQVGIGTRDLQDNDSFQAASYGFTVFAILSPLVAVALILGLFFVLLVYNLVRTLQFGKRKTAKMKNLVDDI